MSVSPKPSRRGFLSLAAGLLSVVGIRHAAPAPSPLPMEAIVTPLRPPPQFGYSLDGGEFFNIGFATREAALEEALQFAERGFVTAEVSSRPITWPHDLRESVVGWLINRGSLRRDAQSWLTGCNEDNDYEGDFEAACCRVSGDLTAPVRAIIAAAIRRAGDEDWAVVAETEIWPLSDPPEELLTALEGDDTLHPELLAVMQAWAERHDLEPELRTLDTSHEELHVPRPEMDEERSA